LSKALPDELQAKFSEIRQKITSRLEHFSQVKVEQYFYELCFCICTPQSKAKNAYLVQLALQNLDFRNKEFDPTPLLRNPANYIRFHNQKARRLLEMREQYEEIEQVLLSDDSPVEKRRWLTDNLKGFGMKESSHFLRNIGCRDLAILDRHILKHLANCGLYDEIPKLGTKSRYLEIEKDFKNYAADLNVTIDELDLLFWSYETGEIFK
jgi:N-glycosylase/DNA lyase